MKEQITVKEQILDRLMAVYNALDRVSVCGKNNLINVSGSMAAIEEIERMIVACDIKEQKE